MTNRLLVAPLVLAAACVDTDLREPPADPTTAVALRPIADAAGAPMVIAAGGTQGFAIDDRRSVGWSADATAGFQVEPYDHVWPNTKLAQYWVRADGTASGNFEIVTNQGIAGGSLESAAVASVALVPADYQLDGRSAFALDVARPGVQAILLDRDGRPLVDVTLALGAGQIAWDRTTVTATAGRHTVDAYADSFADRALAIDLVDHVDRTEIVTTGARTCVHAYVGAIEVATHAHPTGTPEPRATNCTLADR